MMKQFKYSIATLTPLKRTNVLTFKDTAQLATYRRQIMRMFQNRVSRFICPLEINPWRHAWRIRTTIRRRKRRGFRVRLRNRVPRALVTLRGSFVSLFFHRERREKKLGRPTGRAIALAFRRTIISNESKKTLSHILKCPTKFTKFILYPNDFVQRQSQIVVSAQNRF